ncbi:Syntaxin-41 [Porphyridium purpureum]|uniref:Syntaxin-41 n=1 Tax=Porphyridium purpureum TaxID=35688 RepID=A0A5J4YTW4_PORPP|nr:Syntaxin-41 [Porphyridium purpureum]|eukprot:POR7595..scf227_4
MVFRDRTSLFLRLRGEARAYDAARRVATQKQQRQRSALRVGGHEYSAVSQGQGSRRDHHDAHNDDFLIEMDSLESDGRSGSGGDPLDSTGDAAPEWVRTCDELRADMSHVREQIAQLQALHNVHLLPGFGEEDKLIEEENINQLAGEITRSLRTSEQKVKRLGGLYLAPNSSGRSDVVDGHAPASDDERASRAILESVQKSFGAQLQVLSMQFRTAQKEYLKQLQGQKAVLGIGVDAEEQERALRHTQTVFLDDTSTQFRETDFVTVQAVEHDTGEEYVQQRAREIDKVVHSINDLAYLMKDLSNLVEVQGTILDRVDYNVLAVRESTQNAVKELRRAERHHRKRHGVSCIICLTLACGVMALILVFKWLF